MYLIILIKVRKVIYIKYLLKLRKLRFNIHIVPNAQEIQSGEVAKRSNYKRVDIPPSVNDAKNKVGEVVNNAGEVANNAGKKVIETADDASESAKNATVKTLLSAFDNFLPKEPTSNKSAWIARPIIAAAVNNTLSLFFLLITNEKYRILCYYSALILILISLILNVVSFFVTWSLFSLVFDVIAAIPGIGDNKIGPAIYLSCTSACFLFIALNLIMLEYLLHKHTH